MEAFGSVGYIYIGWCPDVANSGSCRGKNARNRGKGVKPGFKRKKDIKNLANLGCT